MVTNHSTTSLKLASRVWPLPCQPLVLILLRNQSFLAEPYVEAGPGAVSLQSVCMPELKKI